MSRQQSNYIIKKQWKRTIIKIFDFGGYVLIKILLKKIRAFHDQNNGKYKKILILILDNLGDVIVATPAIREIKRLYPNSEITCVVGSWSKDVLLKNPNIGEILTYNARWLSRGRKYSSIIDTLKFIFLLRRKHFDIGIQFRVDLIGLFLLFLSGAKRTFGYGCLGGGFLLTDMVPYELNQHIIEQSLKIVKTLSGRRTLQASLSNPGLEIFIPQESEGFIDELLRNEGLCNDKLLIGIHPVPGAVVKYWIKDYFASVCDKLIEKHKANIVITGEKNDAHFINEIIKTMKHPAISFAGKTDFHQLCGLISRLSLLVTVDTVARHIASSFGVPVVTLIGGVDDEFSWGAYGKNHYVVRKKVDCSPCGNMDRCIRGTYRCMTQIKPNEVLAVCEQVLALHCRRNSEGELYVNSIFKKTSKI